MALVTASAVRARLAAGEIDPVYLLVGADDVEKAAMAAELAAIVEEDLRPFNVDRLRGSDATADRLIDAAQTLPMMADRRVIVVADAERLLQPKRESKAADAEMERLEAFLARPPAHAAIVFVCGALDQRRRVVKLLLREAVVVDCGTIVDAADAERWVKARAARDQIALGAGAARALVEQAGPDLVRLRNGLERAALYALGQPEISADDVRASVAAAPEAQVDFGIAKAIWRNDARDALRELGLALDGGAAPFLILGQLRAAAEKLPASQVGRGIDAVFRTDLALKSSGGDPRVLLERLVVELSAGARGQRWGGSRRG
jgi:DNA polymerase-3 subunit delta